MSGLRESQHLKIPLKEIQQATKNFQTCIGRGGYGPVYKGELSIYGKITTVAVKRLNEQLGQGLKEFLTEIQLLTGQNHPNLISLLGFCDEGKEKIIVYEYAERGSLDRYLTSSNVGYTLTWLERLRVCVDAARGLDHLHNHVGKHQAIIHRDIKSANILLDQNWVAKISDLGLSKLCFAGLDRSAVVSHPCGTHGYCEPEYADTGIVKKESDVYSFGMVLFEVLCGRLCSFRHQDGLLLSARLARVYYEKKKLTEIIDPGLREQMSLESMNKFSATAYRCVQEDRGHRPAMDVVVRELVGSLEIQVEYESAKPESSRVVQFDSEEMKLPQDSEDITKMLSAAAIYTSKEEPFLFDNKEKVRTVKVSNVSLRASEQDIKEFFSFSGDIEYVDMQSENEWAQNAYVTFKDAQGAETAVLLSGATIVDQSVTITLVPEYTLPPSAVTLSVQQPTVRTVKVSNVSLRASEQDIKEFFSFSGDIEYVDMQSENERAKNAYVTFKDAQGAETAVLLSGAIIVDQYVTVTLVPEYTLPPSAVTSSVQQPTVWLINLFQRKKR